MKPSAGLASLHQLASLRLPARMIQGTVSLLMRELVRAQTFTILWLDEDCNPWDICCSHLCPRELCNHFITHFLNTREEEAYEPHWKFMRGTSRYDLLHRRRGYQETGLYCEFARPMGFGPVVRLAVRRLGRPVAAVWMTRPIGDKDFSQVELVRLSDAASYLEHVLLGGVERLECDSWSGETGWLVADSDGIVQHFAPGTEAMLHMAADVPRGRAALSAPCYEWARPLLRRLATRISALETGRAAGEPALSVQNDSGQYELRAHRLLAAAGGASNLIGVQIMRRVPLVLRALESPHVQTLPLREKQTCLMLMQGLTLREIASRMGISSNGVAQHVRTLYRRLQIHSREELIRTLTSYQAP
jgi:DNA-binding CsgD family transcriptional regulator